ncbi:MAG: 23S rRNA (uracil(1939)-C(5))-methyltransferase RlmD [Bilifractor sp.]|jgi:23S rRNA (uracil1939-C5)-methyltransferase
MKKGETYEGTVRRISFPNKGHVTVGDRDVIVKNALPGQTVRFRINKKKAGRTEAQLLEVLEPSPLETQGALCSGYPSCGGCFCQSMACGDQLRMKEREIRELLAPAFDRERSRNSSFSPDTAWEGILPSPESSCYRNKMEYAFGDSEKDGPLTLGLHRKNSMYDILTADDCILVHPDFNAVVRCTLEFFSGLHVPYFRRISHEGYLRHLLVRRGVSTGEMLIDLVTTSQDPFVSRKNKEEDPPLGTEEMLKRFADRLLSLNLSGSITGILHTENDSVADVVKNDRTEILYGRDYFYENLLGLKFRITPFSFFQTNTKGAEVLYRTVMDFLGDVSGNTVFDLYSGTGTIAQILAPAAKNVVGVEIMEEAVRAAVENAAENGLDNCRFIAGDVLKVLDGLEEKPDAIVLDPPRDGIHPKALPKIIACGVKRIVYISCKPTSLARDLEVLQAGGCRIRRVRSIDMFPNTANIETVCLLCKSL